MKIVEFSKLVGNTVGKGEIARYEQFLLFHSFKTGIADTLKPGLVWERINSNDIVFHF